jgi:SAM-dependent methyltransferase
MVHHNECPLCTSANILPYLRCTDHFLSKEQFTLYKCSHCGFIFTQDYPEESEISKYYDSDDYISHNDSSKGFVDNVYLLVRKAMLQKKKKIINHATGKRYGNLLDIGSGSGHFAETMKNAGWKVKGIEINRKARDFSISRFGLDIISPEQISGLESDSFDCITLWHVFEHFHHPFSYASHILRILKPGGVCVVALPNSNSYDAKYYGPNWAAYDVPRHLWHFNPSSFMFFSEKSGFILETQRNLPLDVFYISILSEKYSGSGLSFLKGIIKALPFAILSVNDIGRSSSVIYFIRKPADQ